MARKATWQRHADPRNAPRGAIYHILHYVYIYINRSLSSPYKGGSYPYKRSGIIYPTVSLIKVRVGLFFFNVLTFQVTWREEERRIQSTRRSHASIA